MADYDPNDPVTRADRTVPASTTVVNTTSTSAIIGWVVAALVVVVGGWMWYTHTTPTQAVDKVESTTSNTWHKTEGAASDAVSK